MITVPLINWQDMGAMPEDRKDGGQILLWNYAGANIAEWSGGGWYSGYVSEMDGGRIMIEDVTYWADINPPE